MDIDNLIHMANRIGEFFAAWPDADEARSGIADHIHKFWEPRMRRELLVSLDRDGAPGLKPIVVEALRQYRAQLQA